ncbi:MAG: hypothetical protein ACR2LA_07180, partial [Acidimicrobiales bacterium]
AFGELADDLLRRVSSSRHLSVLSCHRHDGGGDQTAQPLDHYNGLTSTALVGALAAILDRIDAGELTASTALRGRLEGAAAALDAVEGASPWSM